MHEIIRKYVPQLLLNRFQVLQAQQRIDSFAKPGYRNRSLAKASQKLLDLLYERKHEKPFFICFDEAHTLTQPPVSPNQKTALGHLEWALTHLRRSESVPPAPDASNSGMPSSDSANSNVSDSSSDKPFSNETIPNIPEPGRIFTLFMSTNSDMDKLAMSADQHPSHRVRANTVLFPPITEFPFDAFAADIGSDGQPTLKTVSQLKHAAKFGRPMYVCDFQGKSAVC